MVDGDSNRTFEASSRARSVRAARRTSQAGNRPDNPICSIRTELGNGMVELIRHIEIPGRISGDACSSSRELRDEVRAVTEIGQLDEYIARGVCNRAKKPGIANHRYFWNARVSKKNVPGAIRRKSGRSVQTPAVKPIL